MPDVPLLTESPAALAALTGASVLYTDLDGTLLGRGGCLLVDGEGAPSTTAAEAVCAVNRADLDVRIVSGRSAAQLTEIARMCDWSGFIAELGCVIVAERGERPAYFTGDWPDGAVAPGDTPFEMIARAGALARLQELFPGRIEEHGAFQTDREATHVLRGCIDAAAGAAALASLDPPVDLVDNGIIRPAVHTLTGCEQIHAYHLVPAGAHKSRAVAADLARRGLSRADAIAIGDSEADLRMADEVGLMVLVGNALDDPRVTAAAVGRDNVVRVSGRRGDGWAELAHAWVAARGA